MSSSIRCYFILASVSLFAWLWGWGMLSCYFPCLLSARHYYVVKSPVLRKILISTQLNRSRDTKTRLADRDKLSLIGVIYYVAAAFLLLIFYISILRALASLAFYSAVGLVLLGLFSFLFYQVDYGVGKHLRK